MTKNTQDILEALIALLKGRKANTQEQLCIELESQGFEANQSKISRLLRKVKAVKVEDERGQTAYSLPKEPSPPSMHTPISELILDVDANETLIVITTSPGSASMVARVLDYAKISNDILGTIAGDDTIFVAPKSVRKLESLLKEIRTLLEK